VNPPDPFRNEIAALAGQFRWTPAPTGEIHDPGRLVLAGLGGSALAGDFLALAASGVRPVPVIRDELLPPWVGQGDTVLCVSCSGSTGETLSVWDEAGRRGADRAAVASGGSLLERARAAGAAHCSIPTGLSPRSSLGYLVRAGAALVGGAVSATLWDAAAAHLESVAAVWGASEGEAWDLAQALRGRLPLIMAMEPHLIVAARRWAGNLAENAKVPAIVLEFPEAAHNALMVFADETRNPVPVAVVTLGEPRHPAHRRRWGVIQRLLQEQGVRLNPVSLRHQDPWIEALGLAHAGDWTSVALAEIYGVDASSLSLMDRLKTRLAADG